MGNGGSGATLRQLDKVFRTGTLSVLADGPLLERFVLGRDEDALEALIARHEPLVRGVCGRFLHDRNDVEDAFQATLLILVRQARSIRVGDSLGPWLYGVAYRVAVRARANARRREALDAARLKSEVQPQTRYGELYELQPILHEELNRLPEKLRAPIVLCYLEGLTHDLAAEQLRWPVGTVRSRLARARELLRSRLSRRGVTCSAGLFTAALAAQPASAVSLLTATRSPIKAAARVAAGAALAEVVSAPVITLMEGVLQSMITTKLKTVAGALLVCGFVAASAVVHAYQSPPPPEVSSEPKPTKDAFGPSADVPFTFTRTYYVGDLLMIAPPPLPPSGPKREKAIAEGGQSKKPDPMEPMIDLITSTIEPGTWTVRGEPYGRGGPEDRRKERVGTITPYYLSVSLIIRHDPETHDKVANLLRLLRQLQESCAGRQKVADPPTTIVDGGLSERTVNVAAKRAARTPVLDNSRLVRRKSPIEGEDGHHLRELLKEMNEEVEVLLRERDQRKETIGAEKPRR